MVKHVLSENIAWLRESLAGEEGVVGVGVGVGVGGGGVGAGGVGGVGGG